MKHRLHAIIALAAAALIGLAATDTVHATPATGARNTPQQTGAVTSLPMAASTTLYRGTLACINSSGYVVTAADTAGYTIAGVVLETTANSGDAGDTLVKISRNVFKFANSGTNAVDIDDVGDPIYIEDNQTLCDSSNNAIYAGLCLKVEDDGVWVDVRHPQAASTTVADAAVTLAKLANAVADVITSAPSVTVANTGTPDGVANVTIQLKDAQGNNLAARAVIRVWFDDAAYGVPTDLGTLTASTGAILKEDTDDALATCVTDANGALVLALDTATDGTVHAMATVGGLAATGNAAITGNP